MNRTSPKKVKTLTRRAPEPAAGVFRFRVRLQCLFAGTAACAFTTDDVIRAESTQQAEQRAIALWRNREPERTFYPFLTVQVEDDAQGITLADLLGFAQAEGLEPANVELAVVAGDEVVPAAIRPGARNGDARFVITTQEDAEAH